MIREARLDDLDSLIELEKLCFEHDLFHRRQLRYLITKAQGKVILFERTGKVAGDLIVLWRRNSTVARIVSIAVRPEYRSQGIGAALLKQAETLVRSRGLKRVNLEVRLDNTKAVSFYENCGYTSVGLRTDYYGDGMAGVSYSKLL